MKKILLILPFLFSCDDPNKQPRNDNCCKTGTITKVFQCVEPTIFKEAHCLVKLDSGHTGVAYKIYSVVGLKTRACDWAGKRQRTCREDIRL